MEKSNATKFILVCLTCLLIVTLIALLIQAFA